MGWVGQARSGFLHGPAQRLVTARQRKPLGQLPPRHPQPAGQAPPPSPAGTPHLKLAIGPLDLRLQLRVLLLQRHCLALQVCQLVLQRGWSIPDMQSNAFSGSPAGHGVMIAEGDWQLPTDVLSGCPLL